MRQALAEQGIRMSRPLGFNNTYAIGMRKEVVEKRGIRTISDLRNFPDLRFGFSNEFRNRADWWIHSASAPGWISRLGSSSVSTQRSHTAMRSSAVRL